MFLKDSPRWRFLTTPKNDFRCLFHNNAFSFKHAAHITQAL